MTSIEKKINNVKLNKEELYKVKISLKDSYEKGEIVYFKEIVDKKTRFISNDLSRVHKKGYYPVNVDTIDNWNESGFVDDINKVTEMIK